MGILDYFLCPFCHCTQGDVLVEIRNFIKNTLRVKYQCKNCGKVSEKKFSRIRAG